MTNLSSPNFSKTKIYLFAYLALVFISVAAMASYFAYDCIGPLIPQLKDQLKFTDAQAYWLYSIYSIPVILFVVLGGILSDKLGVKKSAILFAATFALGTLLTASENFSIMIIGRFLFGIGAEAYYVIMNKILAKWLKGRGLAMAFGVNLFLCRAGTWAAFFGLPWMANNFSLSTTLWLVAGINVFGLVVTFFYSLLDNYGEKNKIVIIAEGKADDGENFNIKEALKLPLAFWIISLLCMVYYSAIFPFQGAATDFFIERYGLGNIGAARLASILVTISMLSTWLFGALVDRIGKRASLLIVGSLAMIPTHISMAYTNINPWIPMVVLGLSFSLVPAALWPALPLMVKERQLGTAYGVIAMVQNIGLFAFPLLVAWIHTKYKSYNPAMIMFAGLGVLGLIFSIWLKIVEAKGGHYLEKA